MAKTTRRGPSETPKRQLTRSMSSQCHGNNYNPSLRKESSGDESMSQPPQGPAPTMDNHSGILGVENSIAPMMDGDTPVMPRVPSTKRKKRTTAVSDDEF
jgi:hypothetical protein